MERTVDIDAQPAVAAAYEAAWQALEAAVRGLEGHSWRFRNAADSRYVIEFIEYDDASDILKMPAIADALGALEIVAVTDRTGTWKEWQSWRE